MDVKSIIFQDAMVRALLDGRKTQARRVVKPQPATKTVDGVERFAAPASGLLYESPSAAGIVCPYGQPGDLLWVREAWAPVEPQDRHRTEPVEGAEKEQAEFDSGIVYRADGDFSDEEVAWNNPLFMPKVVSRLTLRLTDVRVERVQEISEEDAEAEGVPFDPGGNEELGVGYGLGFARLWDSINAAKGYGWDANPWVWCLSFSVIRQNIDEVLRDEAS